MNAVQVFLAEVGQTELMPPLKLADPAMRERVIIFGAIGLVTLLLLFWAAFIRKRRRRRHSHHHHHHHHHPQDSPSPAEVPEAPSTADASAAPEKRRRRRRSHHQHRPRNPTLAETGGLPPIRPESPPDAEP
jgi:type VI protein secretion system component VasK